MRTEIYLKSRTFLNFLKGCSDKNLIIKFVEENRDKYKRNIFNKRLETFKDISNVNTKDTYDEMFEKYILYWISPSSLKSKEYRYGKEYSDNMRRNLLNRPKIDRSKQNNYDPSYIANVHDITLEEAKIRIKNSKVKLSVSSKKSMKELKLSGYNFRENNPLCLEYWEIRTPEKAIENYNYHMLSTRTNVEGFSIRHGAENGQELFDNWVKNRRQTFIERYGSTAPVSGRTSKQSIKFFIPLYKELRQMGFHKNDICWGIRGSKEFCTMHEGKSYFYDFTIKSIRYIIEYNGSFWHSHPDTDYRGFLDEQSIIDKDRLKKKIMSERDYTITEVWDFEDEVAARKRILEEIKNYARH